MSMTNAERDAKALWYANKAQRTKQRRGVVRCRGGGKKEMQGAQTYIGIS